MAHQFEGTWCSHYGEKRGAALYLINHIFSSQKQGQGGRLNGFIATWEMIKTFSVESRERTTGSDHDGGNTKNRGGGGGGDTGGGWLFSIPYSILSMEY